MFSFYFLPFISFTGLELEPVTATLSSTLGNNADFGAGKCIDGNTEGPDQGTSDGANADFCHTNDEPMPWIALDYGTTDNVQRVDIFNRRANQGRELEIFMSAFPMSFLLLAARCFLVVSFLAIFLELPQMGNK